MTIRNEEDFEQALEECCARVRGGTPLQECLLDYPAAYREELARLAPLTGRVAGIASDPSLAYQQRLQTTLLGQVDAKRAQRPGFFRRLTSSASLRAVAAALLLVVLVGGGIGATQASAESLPGEPLYQVKTTREAVQRLLARDPEAQVEVRATQIQERAKELDQALRKGKLKPAVMQEIARRVTGAVAVMVRRADLEAAAGNPRPAMRAQNQLRIMQERLASAAPQASPEIRPIIASLQQYLSEQQTRLDKALPTSPRRP
jgi:hypothetical protein